MSARSTRAVFCNPLDLAYRLQDFAGGPLRAVFREAADPSVVYFRDRFFMFASMSGGYWHSTDMADWQFQAAPTLPVGGHGKLPVGGHENCP